MSQTSAGPDKVPDNTQAATRSDPGMAAVASASPAVVASAPDQVVSPHGPAGSAREREHFLGSAKLVAGLTLLSRIAGMLRAMAIASLGASGVTDTFAMAFRIPNFFRRLLGEGAMASAFVPVFTETSERHGQARADALLNNALGILSAVLVVVMVLVLGGLRAWLYWTAGKNQLLVGLTATMLPFMVTVCVLALCSAALNCRGHFAYPAWSPVLLNLVIIAAAWFVAPLWHDDLAGKLYVIAVSVSVAGVIQVVWGMWLLRRHGFTVRPRLWPLEDGIRTMLRTMAPMLVGMGLLQLTELLEGVMAYALTAGDDGQPLHILGLTLAAPLTEGSLVRLDAARYLYQFPLGVLANSLAVVVFPLLNRYAARGDWANLRDSVNRAIRLSLLEGLAAGVGLLMLAQPILGLIYRHGKFTDADVAASTVILQSYAVGMWAYCSYQIFVRAFYALKDITTPLKVSCWLMLLELVMVGTLVWWLGLRAFGVTTAVIFCINTAVLAALLRRRLGRFGARRIAVSVARSLVACAAMAGVIWALRGVLDSRGYLTVVGVCVPAGALVFVGVLVLLRGPEVGELLGSLRRRRGREAQADAAGTPEAGIQYNEPPQEK